MAKMKKSVTGTSPIWQVCTYAVLLLVVLVAVFPAIWMLSTSIKLPTEQYDIPPQIIPDTPTISNYVNVLTNSKMYLAFINSVIITACVVAVTLFISILAGYGLSRYKFKGHGILKIALLFGQMIPSVVIIIPLYFLVAKTGLLDTHFSLIMADLALTIPMGVIMLSSFFETVPKELEEAAKIDGASGVQSTRYIALPLLKSTHTTVIILGIVGTLKTFDIVWLITQGGPARKTEMLTTMLYRSYILEYKAGYAAAIAVVILIIALVLSCINLYFQRKDTDY